MPRLSDEVEEGVLVTWFVRLGSPVQEGDLLAEPGGVVRQGDPIVVIEEVPEAEVPVEAAPAEEAPPPPSEAARGPAPSTAPATPAARRLARELRVDLARVGGSGPGGRIVEADVRAVAERAGGAPKAPGPRLEPITPARRAIADRLRSNLAATAQRP